MLYIHYNYYNFFVDSIAKKKKIILGVLLGKFNSYKPFPLASLKLRWLVDLKKVRTKSKSKTHQTPLIDL